MKQMSKKEMITFASGDLFGGGAQLVISFFYLIFLTDVVKISPIFAGTVILISKIWDAISDPLMGIISDNTRTRFGRRKPYLFAGFFLIIIAFTLLWVAPDFNNEAAKFAFVAFSYLFFSTISTMVMVPYAAFSSEISTDVKERGRVNGMRLFFSQLSSLIGAVLPMVIVGMFAEKNGYVVMGFVFSIFYALPFLGITFLCKERVEVPKEKSKFKLEKIISPFKVKSFRMLVGMYLTAFFVMDVVSAVFSYYVTYFLGREELLELVLGTMLITQIVFLPLVIVLSEKVGKPKTFIIGAVIFIAGAFMLGFYNASWPIAAIFVISAIVGVGLIGCIVMPWVMYPVVADISVLAFGERRSGSFAGFMTFLRKFSSAFGIWIVGFMLQFSGYMAPGEVVALNDAKLVINDNDIMEVDLYNDSEIDFLVDLNTKTVEFLTTTYNYEYENEVLTIYDETGEAFYILEDSFEISEYYDYSEDATIKSVKSLSQPDSFILGLRVIVFVLPGVLLSIAILIAFKYPLTPKLHKEVIRYNEIHAKEADDKMSDEEILALKEKLI